MKNIISIVLLVVSVGAFLVYVDPQYKQIKNLLAEQAQYNEALDQIKELSDKRDELLVTYRNLTQSDLVKLEKMIPKNVDNVKQVMDIDGIAGKYGIAIGSIKIGKTGANPNEAPSIAQQTNSSRPYNELNMTFSFKTSQDRFVSFIKDLEKSVRITDIDGISLRADDTGTNTYEMSIKTYWVK